jgi:hypothetical protein
LPSRLTERLVREATTSIPNFIELLRRGLDWPIPATLESVPLLDYRPEDLGLDPSKAASRGSLQQIPQLEEGQAFGTFFMSFEGGRLPQTALREYVGGLVRRRRRAYSAGGHWSLDDIFFFCIADNADPHAHIVCFTEVDGRRMLRSISWSHFDTEARIRRLMEDELPRLAWPTVGSADRAWLMGARESFALGYREEIRTSARLATMMAQVARDLRTDVETQLAVSLPHRGIASVFAAVRDRLLPGLTAEDFAGMYAQTMVYGLLVSRLSDPARFGLDVQTRLPMFGTPLLSALYAGAREADEAVDVDQLGLADLALALRDAPIEAILDRFGAADRRDDPVVNFYESFLEEFDPADRKALGQYYTQMPVVRFIVRAVDQVIQSVFQLPDGLADASTWRDVAERHGIAIPRGVEPDDRFIRMVDPATGTGTFLLEWVRQTRRRFLVDANRTEEDWSEFVRKVVLPSMAGLEIRLAPYAVAHVKIALELHERSVVGRVPVYLTNTMTPSSTRRTMEFFGDPLTDEASRADVVKDHGGTTVVIGNPPWGDKAKGKGAAVESVLDGRDALLDDFTPAASRGQGAHLKLLRNLYVFFWRWALDRAHGTPKAKPGVVAFVTSSAWLSGAVFETMRAWIREGCHVWIVDLGGDLISDASGDDENVFPAIRTPSAICIVARGYGDQAGVLRTCRLRGSREMKYEWLETTGLDGGEWSLVDTAATAPIVEQASDLWRSFVPLGDLMPFSENGVHQQRTWVNDPSLATLKKRWRALTAARGAKRALLMKETSSRKISSGGKNLVSGARLGPLNVRPSKSPCAVVRYSFRTLDRQWLIADSRVIDRPSPNLWAVRGNRQIFLSDLPDHPVSGGPLVVPSLYVANLDHYAGRGGRVTPVFRDSLGSVTNLIPGLSRLLSSQLGVNVSDADVVAYICGVAGLPGLVARFSRDSAHGGVRIPLTTSGSLFERMVALGNDVIELFTYGERSLRSGGARHSPRVADGPRLARGSADTGPMPDRFEYDGSAMTLRVGAVVIDRVRADVMDYHVNDMAVVKKWLGYRRAVPTTKYSSPLNNITATRWSAKFTGELLDLLGVITQLRDLEPDHCALLDEVLSGSVVTYEVLVERGVVPFEPGVDEPIIAGGDLTL